MKFSFFETFNNVFNNISISIKRNIYKWYYIRRFISSFFFQVRYANFSLVTIAADTWRKFHIRSKIFTRYWIMRGIIRKLYLYFSLISAHMSGKINSRYNTKGFTRKLVTFSISNFCKHKFNFVLEIKKKKKKIYGFKNNTRFRLMRIINLDCT